MKMHEILRGQTGKAGRVQRGKASNATIRTLVFS
jgi:hypothetical protein